MIHEVAVDASLVVNVAPNALEMVAMIVEMTMALGLEVGVAMLVGMTIAFGLQLSMGVVVHKILEVGVGMVVGMTTAFSLQLSIGVVERQIHRVAVSKEIRFGRRYMGSLTCNRNFRCNTVA